MQRHGRRFQRHEWQLPFAGVSSDKSMGCRIAFEGADIDPIVIRCQLFSRAKADQGFCRLKFSPS
jgi:hypothetical protein